MRDIQKEYSALLDTYHSNLEMIAGDGKTKWSELHYRLMPSLFRKRLTRSELYQLATCPDGLPICLKDRTAFAEELLAFIVRTYADGGDRKRLIETLSRRCPGYVEFLYTIEFYLAAHGSYSANIYGTTLKDPLFVLGEAYSKCLVPHVRKELASAVRRGFAGFGIQGVDDAEFVDNAMKWYAQQKGRLVLNDRYFENEVVVPVVKYEDRPEFLERFPDGWRRELLFQVEPSRNKAELYEGRDEDESIEGTWQVIDVVDNGVAALQDDIASARCVIDRESLTWTSRRGKAEYRLRKRLPPTEAIDLVRRPGSNWKNVQTTPLIQELLEEVLPAIYEVKGGRLRICHAEAGARERPAAFESPQGSGVTLIVLRREPSALFGLFAGRYVWVGVFALVAVLAWSVRWMNRRYQSPAITGK